MSHTPKSNRQPSALTHPMPSSFSSIYTPTHEHIRAYLRRSVIVQTWRLKKKGGGRLKRKDKKKRTQYQNFCLATVMIIGARRRVRRTYYACTYDTGTACEKAAASKGLPNRRPSGSGRGYCESVCWRVTTHYWRVLSVWSVGLEGVWFGEVLSGEYPRESTLPASSPPRNSPLRSLGPPEHPKYDLLFVGCSIQFPPSGIQLPFPDVPVIGVGVAGELASLGVIGSTT